MQFGNNLQNACWGLRPQAPEALSQLIGYESWFLQKKVSGDSNMVRTTAIAKSFSDRAIQYVSLRKQIENKPIKLLKYEFTDGALKLIPIAQEANY